MVPLPLLPLRSGECICEYKSHKVHPDKERKGYEATQMATELEAKPEKGMKRKEVDPVVIVLIALSAMTNNISAMTNNISAMTNNISAMINNISAMNNNISAMINNILTTTDKDVVHQMVSLVNCC